MQYTFIIVKINLACMHVQWVPMGPTHLFRRATHGDARRRAFARRRLVSAMRSPGPARRTPVFRLSGTCRGVICFPVEKCGVARNGTSLMRQEPARRAQVVRYLFFKWRRPRAFFVHDEAFHLSAWGSGRFVVRDRSLAWTMMYIGGDSLHFGEFFLWGWLHIGFACRLQKFRLWDVVEWGGQGGGVETPGDFVQGLIRVFRCILVWRTAARGTEVFRCGDEFLWGGY